jgi:DNA-binding beta-propeller fold protein YncE
LTRDSAGTLYVANYWNNTILKITPSGATSTFSSTGLAGPTSLAFDRAGNLYALNVGAGNPYIEKFTPGGAASLFVNTPGLQASVQLALDNADNLYVPDSAANTIRKYAPDGSSSIFASTGLNSPRGLAFDTAGNLYASNMGDSTIMRFSPSGDASLFATTTMVIPTYIAVIPEPSAWSLLLLGIPALLVTKRHHS